MTDQDALLSLRLSELTDVVNEHGGYSELAREFVQQHAAIPEFVELAALIILLARWRDDNTA